MNHLIVSHIDPTEENEASVFDCKSFCMVAVRELEGGEEAAMLVLRPNSDQAVVDAISVLTKHLEDHKETRFRVMGASVREGLKRGKDYVDEVATRTDVRKPILLDLPLPTNREEL